MFTVKHRHIVLAKIREELVHDGQSYKADLGERPKFVTVRVPAVLTWLLEGTEADVQAAREYATENGYVVFTYTTMYKNAFEDAKAAILK